MNESTVNSHLNSMLKEPNSIKRKRNGRVNSLMWGGSNQAMSAAKINKLLTKNEDDVKQPSVLYSSRGEGVPPAILGTGL